MKCWLRLKQHKLYVATNAADSTEQDIIQAFERVGLSQYLSGYFCKASLGVSKYDSDFYPAIITQLGVQAKDVTMIGDTLEKRHLPCVSEWFYTLCG